MKRNAPGRRYWIEVYHRNQRRPSLQEITDWPERDVGIIIKFFDDEGIPWAFGCGERMPYALPKEVER